MVSSSSSRLVSVNDLSNIIDGKQSVAELLERLDLVREVDRPEIVKVKLNVPDPATFLVRELLLATRQQQPRNHDWHVLAIMEAQPDGAAPGERTIYETTLRDFRDMAECSAITFGRNPVNDWVIPNSFISRRHGMVVLDDQLNVIVFDGRPADTSTNGLYFMDRQPQITRLQRLRSAKEYVGFGPAILTRNRTTSYLFRLRIEWEGL
jgi:hypothetical protein